MLLFLGCLFLASPFLILALIMANFGVIGLMLYILYMFAAFSSVILPMLGMLIINAKKLDEKVYRRTKTRD